MTETKTQRWLALDILRGLSIIFMLLNLNPGAWEHQFDWLVHAKWAGGHFIDMVAPVFLFCIGAVIPLSLSRRAATGAANATMARHIVIRGLILVVFGLFLNAYPGFDFAHLRIPGVLQRIGVSYALVALFVLFTARRDDGFKVSVTALVAGFAFVVLSWFAVLYFVPVPGFGAPRFDPIGSWPAFFDRMVLTTNHMFIYWPVNGKIEFDPDGLLSTWPVCANVLFGVLAGHAYMRGDKLTVLNLSVCGALMMAGAVGLNSLCPIIKNIWTSTFVLFTCGFSLVSLAVLTLLVDRFKVGVVFFPAKVYGSNPLVAYGLSFLIAPLLDLNWLEAPYISLRHGGDVIFSQWFGPNLASFCFGLVMLTVIFLPLYVLYRQRWFLKL